MITINSKYSIGDTVWLIYDNRVQQTTIEDIVVERRYGDVPLVERIKWKLAIKRLKPGAFGTFTEDAYATEDKLFATKEELIRSL